MTRPGGAAWEGESCLCPPLMTAYGIFSCLMHLTRSDTCCPVCGNAATVALVKAVLAANFAVSALNVALELSSMILESMPQDVRAALTCEGGSIG